MLENLENKPLHVWSLPLHYKTTHFSKRFLLPWMPIPRSSHRICTKICSNKFRKFHRKTPVLESLFNKVTQGKRLKHRCFPVKLVKFLRICFEEHLRSTAPECPRKISPLLVLGKPLLGGRWPNWATNTLYCKYEPHEVNFRNT